MHSLCEIGRHTRPYEPGGLNEDGALRISSPFILLAFQRWKWVCGDLNSGHREGASIKDRLM